MNELVALVKEWIELRDKFGLGDDHALFRIAEIEEKLKDQYNIAEPIEWLLAEERKLI